MPESSIHIPRPCRVRWEALTPTAAGRHCAKCQTQVIDFTRLTQAEVLEYLATRKGQHTCAMLAAPVTPTHLNRPGGARRWLLAAAVLLGWQSVSALGLPPRPLPKEAVTNDHSRITIRGVVLDDSLHVPVPGAYVFIQGTKFGAITNAQGEFTLSFTTTWHLAQKGELVLVISAGHFVFHSQEVVVHFATNANPAPLSVRLVRFPGYVVGKIKLIKPPVPPPGSGKDR
jgi:hypothetical protein